MAGVSKTQCNLIKDCATCTSTMIPGSKVTDNEYCYWNEDEAKSYCSSFYDEEKTSSKCKAPAPSPSPGSNSPSPGSKTPTYRSCGYVQDCSTCTKLTNPLGNGTEKCYWSASKTMCGSFPIDGYESSCNDPYVDSLTTYGDSMQYANKNIQTTDGKRAYVTSTGVVKEYADTETYETTAGLNGCPTAVENLNQTWKNLGFRVGAKMVKGQSCGNETKYVTTKPPENNFDAAWYRKNYPDLQLPSDAAATVEWTNVGKTEGRWPNASLLNSMMSLGKVGYIDPDTNLHTISTNITYNNGYEKFLQSSNVSGTNMKDCTKMNFIKYGDRVVIAANDLFGYLTTDSVMNFGSTKQVFIIRPLPNGSDTGTPVRFGDQVSLALSVSNYTESCGYWGCQVGTIQDDTFKYVFDQGGTTGGTPVQLMPTSTAYSVAENISYGVPFNIAVALIPQNNAMYQGYVMRPNGDPLMSTDEQYYMTFEYDGLIRFYRTGNTTPLWKSDKLPLVDENGVKKNPKQLIISSNGVLQAQDEGGSFYWTSPSKSGTAPFALAAQTDGRLVLYDKNLKEVWGVPIDGNGTIVNKLEDYYAMVNVDSEMVFAHDATKGVYSFQNEDGSSLVTPDKCDLSIMEAQCGNGCIGFIHDGTSNEWQMLTTNMKATDFKVTSTVKDIYMKIPKVSLADKSCKKEEASFVDFSWLSKAVPGAELTTSGKNQCVASDSLSAEQNAYQSALDLQWARTQEDAYDFDTSPLNDLKRTEAAIDEATSGTSSEIQGYMKKLQNLPANDTYDKQVSDSKILDRQSKYRYMLWAIIAVLVAGFILVAWFGGAWAAVYTVGAVIALYLGYILFR